MKSVFQSMQLLLLVFFSSNLMGQGTSIPYAERFTENYSECAAIIFNDVMLVESYSPEAFCSIADSVQGIIRVATVEFTDHETIVRKPIPFRWAIKNKKTGTILSVDPNLRNQIELSEMVKSCGVDDSIIIMTVDITYALPHNEIQVKRGC